MQKSAKTSIKYYDFDKKLVRKSKKISLVWLAIPLCLFIMLLITLSFFKGPISSSKSSLYTFMAIFAVMTWLLAVVQLRFKNVACTIIVALGALSLIGMVTGNISPADSIENFRKSLSKSIQ